MAAVRTHCGRVAQCASRVLLLCLCWWLSPSSRSPTSTPTPTPTPLPLPLPSTMLSALAHLFRRVRDINVLLHESLLICVYVCVGLSAARRERVRGAVPQQRRAAELYVARHPSLQEAAAAAAAEAARIRRRRLPCSARRRLRADAEQENSVEPEISRPSTRCRSISYSVSSISFSIVFATNFFSVCRLYYLRSLVEWYFNRRINNLGRK